MKNILLSFCLLWAAAPLFSGVVFEIETKSTTQDTQYTTNISAQGQNLKMNIANAKKTGTDEMIFRGGPREMVIVDHTNKSFMILDSETMKSLAGTLDNAMSQMQEALKNVPESQRAAIEKMMKDKMPKQEKPVLPDVKVKKTSEKKKIGDYPCVKYQVHTDGVLTRELWVTPWDRLKGSEDIRQAMEGMADFAQEMQDAFAGFNKGNQKMTGVSDNMFMQMKEIEGFPILTKEFGQDGSVESESHLVSNNRKTLDPGDFEPPAGYKKQSMLPTR